MSKYNVTITETLSKTFEIEADTPEQAKEIVEDKYYEAKDNDYILGAEDLSGFRVDTESKEPIMKIRIFQINSDRDKDSVIFESFDRTELLQGTETINSSLYDVVFDGEINGKTLEDVYRKFNIDLPEDYKGRSLSVSDVVEVISSESNNPGFYFCDSVGFKEVNFEELSSPPDKIKVLLLEPNKFAKEAEIGTSLEDLQAVVGGCIEAAYYFDDPVCLVCNDEGKINGMPLNRGIYDDEKKLVDIIAGTAFICDCSGENFGSLSDKQMKKYKEQFKYPERFFRVNEEIKGMKFNPEKDLSR